MMESRPEGSSPNSSSNSFIPVMASPVPRKASGRNALPSSFGFSLLPTPRIASRQAQTIILTPAPSSPSSSAVSIQHHGADSIASSPSPSSPSSTGIPKFRSLRNMLPFGPKQTSIPSSAVNTPSKLKGLSHRRSSSSIPAPDPVATAGYTPVTPKNGFLTFGPRTSFSFNASDRKRSPAPPSPNRSRARSEDHGSSPIIRIEAPPTRLVSGSAAQSSILQANSALSSPRDPFLKTPSPRLSPRIAEVEISDVSTFNTNNELDVTILHGDLSTILESELSSMSLSKRLSLDQDRDTTIQRTIKNDLASPRALDLQQNISAQEDDTVVFSGRNSQISPPPMQLRKFAEAQRAAWSASRTRETTDAEPTESAAPVAKSTNASPQAQFDTTLAQENIEAAEERVELDLSFDLSSLDPDLAALLSPHNVRSREGPGDHPIATLQIDASPPFSPSPSPSPSPDSDLSSPNDGILESRDDIGNSKRHSKTDSSGSNRRNSSKALGPQSSPRRSRPASLTLSTSTQSTGIDARRPSLDVTTSSSAAPRRTLTVSSSATGRTFRGKESPVAPAEDVNLGRASIDAYRNGRKPLLGRSYSALSASSPSEYPRRPYSRLNRPESSVGHVKPRVSSDSRPAEHDREMREVRAPDASGFFSRSVSALGVAHTTKLGRGDYPLHRPRSSESRSSAAQSNKNRNRSMSVNEARGTGRKAPLEWIGPRTIRALAAAGLLDREKDATPSNTLDGPRSESRLLSPIPRNSSEQDFRATESSPGFATSRAGFSDISRSTSWGRRDNISNTLRRLSSTDPDDFGRGDSPVTAMSSTTPTTASASNTRSVFSTSTTTSISGGSPQYSYQQVQLEAALGAQKEKHSLEMEALLNALADSQQSSRYLREENTQLKTRVRELEEQVNDLAGKLDFARRTITTPHSSPYSQHLNMSRTMLNAHSSRPSSTEPSLNLSKRHMRMQSFVPSQQNSSSEDVNALIAIPSRDSNTNFLASPSAASQLDQNIRKRSSVASSIFPVPPSNMTMLLHEDNDNTSETVTFFPNTQTQSSPAASPRTLTQLPSIYSGGNDWSQTRSRHSTRPSVSSIGSATSTNADLTIPSSPGSLHINPGHEKHLGDMMSLDLSIVDSD